MMTSLECSTISASCAWLSRSAELARFATSASTALRTSRACARSALVQFAL